MDRYINPFKNLKLDKEEKEIERAIENNEFVEDKDFAKKKKLYAKYARETLEKKANINIRLSRRTLQKLKAKAAEQGIGYQTLASSILHRYTFAS